MENASNAFLFPGQGSQVVGMGKDLAEQFPIAAQTFAQADEILGFSLSRIAWEDDGDMLNDTANTQPALLTHSIAAWRVLYHNHPKIKASFAAGHSLGQISALVAAGALNFVDALRLVHKRGELMKQAGETSPGGMAAILGLNIPTIEKICQQATTPDQSVQIANDNCPGQVVISGAQNALEHALELAKEAGAKRAIPLKVSIAAHSALMESAREKFAQAVAKTPFRQPLIPVIGNVSAAPLTTPEEIRADLQAQLTAPVRWTESVQTILSKGVHTFFEIGSKNVLCSLLRRIDRQTKAHPLGTAKDFSKLHELLG